jgi:urease accessory protein
MHDRQLLQLFQLFDSQFPVGAFAHSGGLETYGQAGAGPSALRGLIASQISNGWGRAELAAASLAWSAAGHCDAADVLARLATLVSAHKVIPSVHDTSIRLGRRTLALVERLHPHALRALAVDPPHHAMVIGAAGQRLGLPRRGLLVAFAHSLVAASVATATRCMPVSPAQGQALIVELQPALEAAVVRALAASEDNLFTCTPALDIRCHQQRGLTTRLFQS